MITVEDALKDLEIIEKEAGENKSVVKAIKVLVKFLSTMRSNQLLTEDKKKEILSRKVERTTKEEKK
jgi:hypothetical protein